MDPAGSARRFLLADPLHLSREEALHLTEITHNKIIKDVARNYDRDSDLNFFELPSEAQTVIVSVAIQYGSNLGDKDRTPNFWGFVTRGDWEGAIGELENFGDNTPERRLIEAKRLRRVFPPIPRSKPSL